MLPDPDGSTDLKSTFEQSETTNKVPTGRKLWLRSLIAFRILAVVLVAGHFTNSFLNKRNSVVNNDVGFVWEKLTPSSELKWVDCFPNRGCARLEVPLDYTDPMGEKAAVALMRVKAKVPSSSKAYRGPILFNPGGPGGSGVDFINLLGDQFQAVVGEEYDIVGFDPRGIGKTTPQVTTFTDPWERAYWNTGAPQLVNSSSDTLRRTYARSQLFGDLSEARTKHAAQHVSTATVARDMLTITKAHGRDRILYWGFSYGTVLGATFSAMFPDNIERLIIDGVVEFEDYYAGRWYSNLYDTDKVLQYFYDECAAAGPACPLHANTSALVQERVESILSTIDENPFPILEGKDYAVIDHSIMKSILFVSLYQPFALLPRYAAALAALEKGDGRLALGFYRLFAQMPKCNTPPGLVVPQKAEATLAVMCGEGQGAGRDIEDITRHLKELVKLSIFADVWTTTTRINCAGWKIEVKGRYAGTFNTTTRFPLLVIGNTADPVTPLRGAEQASKGFRDSALLTVNTPGHCSLAGTSVCAVKAIRKYFREGKLPAEGTVCEVENRLFGRKPQDVSLSEEDMELLEVTRVLSGKFHAARKQYVL